MYCSNSNGYFDTDSQLVCSVAAHILICYFAVSFKPTSFSLLSSESVRCNLDSALELCSRASVLLLRPN